MKDEEAGPQSKLTSSLLGSGVSASAACAALMFEDADSLGQVLPGTHTKPGVFAGNHGDSHSDSHSDDPGPSHADSHDNSHTNYFQDN
jgi:hypothetical protein